jgi:cation transport regulator ChaC
MDEESFKSTVGEGRYEVLGPAVLKDFRLVFNLYSEHRQGGVADIVLEPGTETEGVLYRLHPAALPALDRREGVEEGHYGRMMVTVCHRDRPVRAITYTVIRKELEELTPNTEYLKLIYGGAVQHLSPSYRKRLAKEWAEKFGIDQFQHLEK